MWWQLIHKNFFEGSIEVKKSMLHACIQHNKQSKELEDKVWQRCQDNNKARGYKPNKPTIPFLLEAFLFENHRLRFDERYVDQDEQMIFAIIEHVRLSIVNGTYNK